MKTLRIQRYTAKHKKIWDDFLAVDPRYSFLFYRDFMEHHKDRFEDYSLMIFHDATLIGLFPAALTNQNQIQSHSGLSYGGLLYDSNTFERDFVSEMYQAIIAFLNKKGITKVNIKLPPSFYNTGIAEQTDVIKQLKGDMEKSFLSMAVDMTRALKIHKSKLKRYKNRKLKMEFSIHNNNDFKDFWTNVLIPCLHEKHQASPVHSCSEIESLHEYFPNTIVQWNLYYEDIIIAGITLFIKNNIVRSQYGATRLGYERLAPLDYLYIYLMELYSEKGFQFFDMGSIPPSNDLTYPQGLVNYKKELGCDIYAQHQFVMSHEN